MIKQLSCLLLALACLVCPMTLSAKDKGLEVIVQDPYVEMHTAPGRGYPIFHVVERNEIIRILKRKTDWFKVRTEDNKVGWVSRKQLRGTLGLQGEEVNFAPPDITNYVKRTAEFGVLGGDFEGADGLSVYLGYRFTPNISAELKYTQSFGSNSDSKLGAFNLVHQPFPEWRISPFFTLGAGIIKTSPASSLVRSEDREDTLLTVGGGTYLYASRRFLLRLEYNNHTILTTRNENEEIDEWKAGLSIFF